MVFAEVSKVLIVLSNTLSMGFADTLFQTLGLLLSCMLIKTLLCLCSSVNAFRLGGQYKTFC